MSGTVGQAVRFLLVGAVAAVVDVGLFNVLILGPGTHPVLAKALSMTASTAVAYAGNRAWSFDAGQERLPFRQELLRYLAVSVLALGVAVAPIGVARWVLELEGPLAMNVAANVVGLGLATAFRFYGYRRWVFLAT